MFDFDISLFILSMCNKYYYKIFYYGGYTDYKVENQKESE